MRKHMRLSLFKLAKKQNGLVSKERTRGFYNIMNVVLASTTGVMPKAISFIWLMLYQKKNQPKELVPHETKDTKGVEILQDNDVRMALKRKRPHYYDKQQ